MGGSRRSGEGGGTGERVNTRNGISHDTSKSGHEREGGCEKGGAQEDGRRGKRASKCKMKDGKFL